jgi:hypothetical protein
LPKNSRWKQGAGNVKRHSEIFCFNGTVTPDPVKAGFQSPLPQGSGQRKKMKTLITAVCLKNLFFYISLCNISDLKLALYVVFFSLYLSLRGEKAIIKKKIVKILNRKRQDTPKERRVTVEEKLRKQERLTTAEFWQVYESIRQDGPVVKYSNPDKWGFRD